MHSTKGYPMNLQTEKLLTTLMALATLNFCPPPSFGQGTAFTYQGSLSVNGAPAGGNYDFQFILFNDSQFGFPAAPILTNADVPISNGLFAVMLDFGSSVFTGTNFWLDISVRTNGSNIFTDLLPRQLLTPAPYAVFANTASNLSGPLPAAQLKGSLPATQLSGTIPLAQLPAAVVTNSAVGVTLNGTFSGDGSGLVKTVTSGNYVHAFDSTTQVNAVVNVFQGVSFDTAALDGWTYSGNAFICNQSGLYLVQYHAEVETTSSITTTISLRAFNGTTANEIPGSQSSVTLAVANLPSPVSQSFLTFVDSGDPLQIQFTGTSTSAELIPGNGAGTQPPSITCTIIRVQ